MRNWINNIYIKGEEGNRFNYIQYMSNVSIFENEQKDRDAVAGQAYMYVYMYI